MMKAMIFAAGLGTRMRPITNSIPKALVPVGGVPLLEVVICRLKSFGIREIIINVHYLADQIETFLQQNNYFDCQITISDERGQLLETGGGLKKAQHFFKDGKPFLVCNTDVVSTIDIHALYQAHLSNNAIATLAVQNRKTSRYFLFDKQEYLSGWMNIKTGEVKLSRLENKQLQMKAFSTFQILDPTIFNYFPNDREKFTTIEVFLKASEEALICAFDHSQDEWMDVGTPDNIIPALEIIKKL